MNEQELARQFADHDLSDWFEAARPLLRSAIRLDLQSADDATLPVGQSKLGGLPDLPDDMAWPQDGGRAMMPIAQIDFAELQAGANGLFWNEYRPQDGACRIWHWRNGTASMASSIRRDRRACARCSRVFRRCIRPLRSGPNRCN